jgi:hypothetical protein
MRQYCASTCGFICDSDDEKNECEDKSNVCLLYKAIGNELACTAGKKEELCPEACGERLSLSCFYNLQVDRKVKNQFFLRLKTDFFAL